MELLFAWLGGKGEHVVDEVEVFGELVPFGIHEETAEAVFGKKRDDLFDVFETLDERFGPSILRVGGRVFSYRREPSGDISEGNRGASHIRSRLERGNYRQYIPCCSF